jgi:ubiquinone/menaquinone biosynthesis C-methylase UbiE
VADDLPLIVEHYQRTDEDGRIRLGFGQLELVRTQEIVRRHLSRRPLEILDVGGGTGVHAEWLAAEGHAVHIVDLVDRHVALAAQHTPDDARGGRVTAEVGDARQLPVEDASFDAVLVFGPLYHLTERDDRVRALREARRAVRPGGPVFVAAISRFASLFDGLTRGYMFESSFEEIVRRDLADGQHRNRSGRPEWFTTAYFHHPDELRSEAGSAGLDVVEIVGVEGLAGWLPHLAERWANERDRQTILFSARAVESEPALLGLSAHLIMATRRA